MSKPITPRRLVTLIKKGDMQTVSQSIGAVADLHALVEGSSLLGWAVRENQPKILRLLMEAGVNVESPDGDGSTPLQICSATRAEHLSDEDAVAIASILIEQGADVMACGDNNHDCAPLAMAKMRGKMKLAALLEEHGAVAFDVVVTMKSEDGNPIVGEFYYGIPQGQYLIKETDQSGKLNLTNVFPGLFVIGFEDEEQRLTIHEDGSASPNEMIWETQ